MNSLTVSIPGRAHQHSRPRETDIGEQVIGNRLFKIAKNF
jgi:hypothetical protein